MLLASLLVPTMVPTKNATRCSASCIGFYPLSNLAGLTLYILGYTIVYPRIHMH